MDAGAGVGTYTLLMLNDGKSVAAIESVPSFVAELGRRFAGEARVTVYQGDLADAAAFAKLPEIRFRLVPECP